MTEQKSGSFPSINNFLPMQNKSFFSNLPSKEKIKEAKIPFKNGVKIILILNTIVIFLVLLLLKLLPPQIPLFYGLAEGEEQLASDWMLILPCLVSLTIIIINLVIALNLKDEFFKKILVLTGITAGIFAIVTVVKIFFLVGGI